jgi:tetratricopeptide (TPR) repeat protein
VIGRRRCALGFLLCILLLSSLLPAAQDAAAILEGAVADHRAGRLQEALDGYREALRDGGLAPADAARAHNNACTILSGTGDYGGAMEECEAALDLRRDRDDRRGMARTLNNLGLTLLRSGDLPAARSRFQEALAINRERDDAAAEVINLANLGVVETEAGRYGLALDWHRQAEALATARQEEPWAREQVLIARINQGVILERLGAFREALERYRSVLPDEESLGQARAASLRLNLGVVYRNLGDPVRAVEAFESASEAFQQAGDTASLANARLNLALSYHLNLGSPDRAETAYREALALADSAGDQAEAIRTRTYLGRFLLESDHLEEAERLFEEALSRSEAMGQSEGVGASLAGLGEVAEARGDLPAALGRLRDAMDRFEQTGGSIPLTPLRSGYFGERRPVYAAAIRVLAALNLEHPSERHGREALEVSQRAKARDLLEALGTAEVFRRPLDAKEIAVRARGSLLLDYFTGADRAYRFAVEDGNVTMTDVGPAHEILGAVDDLHDDLEQGVDPDPELLDLLSARLLGGLEGTTRRVRIVPDGVLYYVPFEILRLDGVPLVDRATVTYWPTASVIRTADAPAGELTLAGFAAPVLPVDGNTPIALVARRLDLPPLEAAPRDLAAARSWLGGEADVRIGVEATEEAFRRDVARGARVLHLATHTVLEEQEGRGGAVLLTPSGEDDGLLHPDELAAMRIGCSLAVIATCRSGIGSIEDGSALRSLTGAFLAGGAQAVVATLWDVGDEATAVFMEQFYYELSRGRSPADALRRTKLRLREQPGWEHPYLWSGFVLVGEAAPVTDPARPWLRAALVMLMLALFAAALLGLRRVRRGKVATA